MDAVRAIAMAHDRILELCKPEIHVGLSYDAHFMYYSYLRWSYIEIIKKLTKCIETREHPTNALMEMLEKAKDYSCMGSKSMMFSVLADTLRDFIDELEYYGD